MLVLAVTYNSLHRGECQRQTISVAVPAHTGQKLKSAIPLLSKLLTFTLFYQRTCLFSAAILCFCDSAHKEVLRLHYEDYVRCVSEHNLLRVRAFLEAAGENQPIMTVANVPLRTPEVLVEVGAQSDVVLVCRLLFTLKRKVRD